MRAPNWPQLAARQHGRRASGATELVEAFLEEASSLVAHRQCKSWNRRTARSASTATTDSALKPKRHADTDRSRLVRLRGHCERRSGRAAWSTVASRAVAYRRTGCNGQWTETRHHAPRVRGRG